MRILHVLDHSIPLHSGYTFRTRAILREQRRRGWETVHVTSAKQGPCSGEVEAVEDLTFHRTRPFGGQLGALPLLRHQAVIAGLRDRLRALIAETRPDLLHAHSPALNGIAALGAARQAGLPLVYECRAFWEDAAVDHGTSREGGLRYRLTRSLETRVFRRADAVTTICEGLRADIAARGIPPQKVTVIPNAVDPEHFTYGAPPDESLRRELGLGEGPVLGFLGSFYAYEGLDLLIDALPLLRGYAPALRVLLVGGGNEAEALKARARQLEVDELTVFVGRVPHERVGAYYGLVDLLVYPRRSLRLTELVTPLKPLEAMAQGKLVAASNVGGHRELIRPGATGYLFPPDDPAALADGIRAALAERARWPEVREAARQFVARERTWEASVERYAAVYERVLMRGS